MSGPSGARQPLVSVLMNCYNGGKYLREAISSVIAQSYPNWEIVFWDNRSTDSSYEIVKSFGDSRIKYFLADSHTKLYDARNRAIEKSNGALIAFLDVDDRWLPEKLESQVSLFVDPKVGFACGNFWFESEVKHKTWMAYAGALPAGWVLENLLESYYVGLVTLVVRRTALESLAYPFDLRYHIIGDFDLVIRLAAHWKAGSVQEPVAVYRLHSANESKKFRRLHLEELRLWLEEIDRAGPIGSALSFWRVSDHFGYLTAMNHLLDGDRWPAMSAIRGIRSRKMQMKLTAAALMPTTLVRRLKN